MSDSKIESIIEQIRKRMMSLQERKFFGTLKIEVEYKAGGMCSTHIGDREKIL